MPYKVWEQKLRTKFQMVYKVFKDTGRNTFKVGIVNTFKVIFSVKRMIVKYGSLSKRIVITIIIRLSAVHGSQICI